MIIEIFDRFSDDLLLASRSEMRRRRVGSRHTESLNSIQYDLVQLVSGQIFKNARCFVLIGKEEEILAVWQREDPLVTPAPRLTHLSTSLIETGFARALSFWYKPDVLIDI